jgi:CBS domain containing-hemolysin-like protein
MRESREEGVINESEAQIINRAFEFADKRAIDIMVPASRVEWISLARPLERNLEVIRSRMHTRFPLCRDGFAEILGVVHMKDFWPRVMEDASNAAFERCARAPIFVEPGMRQDQVLKLLRERRGHLAVVRDKSGKCLGILTMEDVLEELVGEIQDEHGN